MRKKIIDAINETDESLIVVFIVLLFFGLIMIYSSSGVVLKDSFYYFKKQLIWMLVGFVFFIYFLLCDRNKLRKLIKPSLFFIIILLVIVFIAGKQVNGARRWIDVGPFNFQPSEFAKFIVILFVADFIDRKKSKIRNFSCGLVPPLLCAGIVSALIIIEPDMGIPAVLLFVVFSMLYVGGARLSHLGGVLLSTIPLIIVGITTVSYRKERFFAFLDPWKSKNDSAYQLVQSFLSLGSGGIFGRGPGRSEIKKFYLPGQHTDFIFSIIGEELGIIGTVMIVLLFTYLLYTGLRIAKQTPDMFSKILCVGLTLSIVIQAYFNIAVCCGCLPTKGISLPFISYGGSSLVVSMSSFGLLMNISCHKKRMPVRFY